jgi:hypothetical protein
MRVNVAPRLACVLILVLAIAAGPLAPWRSSRAAAAAVAPSPSAPGAGSVTALGIGLKASSSTQPQGTGRGRFAKVLADWSIIEAQRGTFAWNALDAAVTAASRDGTTPTVILAHTPRWATVGTGMDLSRPEIFTRQPPRDAGAWDRFVGAAAARYKDRVKDWQIWTQLGLPYFRGTGQEYAALVQSAHRRLRAADGTARVAMATPTGVDLTFIVRASQELGASLEAVNLTAQGFAPEALLRPFAVVARRVRPQGKAVWLDWAPNGTAGGDRTGAWLRLLAVAHASGVERVFTAGAGTGDQDLRQAAAPLGTRSYTGHLTRDPDVYAVVFGEGADALIVAWATADGKTLEIAAPAVRAQNADGQAARTEVRDGRTLVSLSLAPILISGIPGVVVEEAKAAAGRGPMVPVVASNRDYGQGTEVSAVLGRTGGEERGLYNMPFRSRRNGAVEVVEAGGVEAVRTSVSRDVVYVYFDVDDTFMYFVEGRTPVEITIEVWGASAERQLGFNLLYDSTNGYRFTPWQWVDVREGWVKYTVRLSDVSMANTWGFDFAINASGNRSSDLTIRSVVVKKLSN